MGDHPHPHPTPPPRSNIGNPQELGQHPITFFREVLALTCHPALLDMPGVSSLFSADAVQRARGYLAEIKGGTGAYSPSQGWEVIRKEVSAFISSRDGGVISNPADIFLTDGASPAVQMLIRSMIRSHGDAIMTPIPQYPLYSASIALYGGVQAGYCLNETAGWRLEPAELKRACAEARAAGKCVRAIVVINPGNPTGNVMSEENMREVIEFAVREHLILLADEVYQANVWSSSYPWKSFKSVAAEMGVIDVVNTNLNAGLQLASFHTVSKGFTGECGRRGGYVELIGFDEAVRSELYKLASISLCANISGQICVGLQCNPPQQGTPSYERYAAERDAILTSLKHRAVRLVNALRALPGVTCEAPEGALYAFPRIMLPAKAVAAAAAAGKPADTYYCLSLLDATGIVVVPGSGFGQVDGTHHFRSTVLPPEEGFDTFLAALTKFHEEFLRKFAD